ncbi:MAG: TRAP transporter small permease subunit [Alkalilacustris sp.]
MLTGFLRLAHLLDRAARVLCGTAAVLLVGLVLTIVVLRYGFGTGSVRLQDAAAYAFAVFLIFSLPVCMAQGGHVRVEVLSERLPPGYLRAADTVALVLFLVPVFGLILWAGWSDLMFSWRVREGSVSTGGLPGLFVVRTALPVAAVLMIVQGLAAVLRPPGAA